MVSVVSPPIEVRNRTPAENGFSVITIIYSPHIAFVDDSWQQIIHVLCPEKWEYGTSSSKSGISVPLPHN